MEHRGVAEADFTARCKLFMPLSDYPGWAETTRHAGAPSKVGACYACHQMGHTGLPGKTIYTGTSAIMIGQACAENGKLTHKIVVGALISTRVPNYFCLGKLLSLEQIEIVADGQCLNLVDSYAECNGRHGACLSSKMLVF